MRLNLNVHTQAVAAAKRGKRDHSSNTCVDLNPQCAAWATAGECDNNPVTSFSAHDALHLTHMFVLVPSSCVHILMRDELLCVPKTPFLTCCNYSFLIFNFNVAFGSHNIFSGVLVNYYRDTCMLLALLLVEYPALFLVKEAVVAAKPQALARVRRAARAVAAHRRLLRCCLRCALPMCATLKNGEAKYPLLLLLLC